MSKKPIFAKVMVIIIVALICLFLTLLSAFLLGSVDADIFDFSNLNLSNMLPILILGIFISCIVVGFLILFLAKDVLIKIKDYFFDTKK